MRTVSALDVRKHFGHLLDQAAAGERIVIERAGQPRAVLVPLADLGRLDPDEQLERQKAALDEIRRLARLNPAPSGFDAVAAVRQARDGRAGQVMQVMGEARGNRT